MRTDGAEPLSVSERGFESIPVALALTACGGLAAVQWGLVPGTERAWGFNLWSYHHPAFGVALALALALLAIRGLREWILAGLHAAAERLKSPGALAAALVAFAAVLWLLRERQLFGDSNILLIAAMSGSKFAFPEIGASWLVDLSLRVAAGFGQPGPGVYQLWVCAAGAATLGFLIGAGRLLSPTARGGSLFAVFVVCGGIARLFAGHVEVYAFVLVGAGAYFWAAAAYLRGRCRFEWVAFAFGVGLWIHLSFAFLGPSLVALPILANPRSGFGYFARSWSVAAVIAVAPMAIFLSAMAVGAERGAIDALVASAVEATGFGSDEARELWLRDWGEDAGTGTRYVMLSAAHLKYLGNAVFVLAPAALPLLIWLGSRPRRLIATPQTTFLTLAAAFTSIYCVILRPIWGPIDWDLFSLPALCLIALSAHLLCGEPTRRREHLALVCIAATLAFVTVPLIAAGIGTQREAGPFAVTSLTAQEGETTEETFERQLRDWL